MSPNKPLKLTGEKTVPINIVLVLPGLRVLIAIATRPQLNLSLSKEVKMVCDSLNMCKERENFIKDGLEFLKVPNFCPWCGQKWCASAICDDENNKSIKSDA